MRKFKMRTTALVICSAVIVPRMAFAELPASTLPSPSAMPFPTSVPLNSPSTTTFPTSIPLYSPSAMPFPTSVPLYSTSGDTSPTLLLEESGSECPDIDTSISESDGVPIDGYSLPSDSLKPTIADWGIDDALVQAEIQNALMFLELDCSTAYAGGTVSAYASASPSFPSTPSFTCGGGSVGFELAQLLQETDQIINEIHAITYEVEPVQESQPLASGFESDQCPMQFISYFPPGSTPPVAVAAPRVPTIAEIRKAESAIAKFRKQQEELEKLTTELGGKYAEVLEKFFAAISARNMKEIEASNKRLMMIAKERIDIQGKDRMLEANVRLERNRVLEPIYPTKILFNAPNFAQGHPIVLSGEGVVGTGETANRGTKELTASVMTTYKVVVRNGKEVVERSYNIIAIVGSNKPQEFKGTLGLSATTIKLNFK